MEDRYWLRHPSLSGHVGPYRLDDLRSAILASSFPRDSYVLLDSGQNETERMASIAWRPVTAVLGMEPPAAAAPAAPVADDPEPTPEEAVRNQVRQRTAYGTARGLIHLLAGLALFGLFVVSLVAVVAPGLDFGARLIILLTLVLESFAVIVAAAMLQAILDIADCNLQNRAS